MNNRLYFTLVLLCSLSVALSAQVDPLTKILTGQNLKTDLTGSYPRHIEEFVWEDEWTASSTTNINYRADGQPLVVEYADPLSHTKTTYAYSSSGMETEMLLQEMVDGRWVNLEKDVIGYANDQLPESSLSYRWDGSDWVLSSGINYAYTFDNGRVAVMIQSLYEEGEGWREHSRYTYTYDGDKQLPQVVVTETLVEEAWSYSSRSTFEYSGNEVSVVLTELWGAGAWEMTMKMEYDYGNYGSVIVTMSTYQGMEDEWTFSMRMTEENDEHSNAILSLTEMFVTEWMLFFGQQYDLTYQGNNVSERITQEYALFDPNIKSGSDQWQNVRKEVFSDFASLSAGNVEVIHPELTIYPNPATSEVSLLLEGFHSEKLEVSVISLLGEEVYLKEFEPSGSINLNIPVHHLPAGVYFVIARSDSSTPMTKKLMINR